MDINVLPTWLLGIASVLVSAAVIAGVKAIWGMRVDLAAFKASVEAKLDNFVSVAKNAVPRSEYDKDMSTINKRLDKLEDN